MCEVFEIGQMGDLIIRYVENTEFGVSVEARDFRKSIMGYVEFFDVGKIEKA